MAVAFAHRDDLHPAPSQGNPGDAEMPRLQDRAAGRARRDYTTAVNDAIRRTHTRNLRGERGKRGRQALVYAYGGGLRPGSYPWVKETYRRRFAIETSYRQLRQARIKTSTRDPLRRLLYVAVALILRNVWVWLHWGV